MSTLLEHAIKLADLYPSGGPVYLSKMATIFWPEADWLALRVNRHNGGARRGARCAGALAGRLEKAGFLWMQPDHPRNYEVKVDVIRKAQRQCAPKSFGGG